MTDVFVSVLIPYARFLDVRARRLHIITELAHSVPQRPIADAMEKVGKDGVITVEEAKTMDTSLDVVESMQSIADICHRTS